MEASPTKRGGERQVFGKSSSDEPSTIFCAGTSGAPVGMSVSEIPTERASVHNSPQTLKPSERAQSDTPTERATEKPKTPEPIHLDNYMTKEKFDHEISKRDQEIVSLKSRLKLTEVNLSLTQVVVHAIQEQLAALSTPPIPSSKDNTTEGEKKTQEKVVAVAEGKGKELAIKGESSFSLVLKEGEIDKPYVLEYVEGVFSAENPMSSLMSMHFTKTAYSTELTKSYLQPSKQLSTCLRESSKG